MKVQGKPQYVTISGIIHIYICNECKLTCAHDDDKELFQEV